MLIAVENGVHTVTLSIHAKYYSVKIQSCTQPINCLIKTGLSNVVLPTLVNVVNNTEQVVETELTCN